MRIVADMRGGGCWSASVPVRRNFLSALICSAMMFSVGSGPASAQMISGAQSAGSAGTRTPAGNPQRGRLVARAKCAACHGLDGNAPTANFPKLAGQNPAYLYWQLWAFKRGQRRSQVMAPIVAGLSDRDMADAASYFASQPRRADRPGSASRTAAGARIFQEGIPGRVPPCAQCHARGAARGTPPMMGGMMGGMMGRGGMGGMGMMGSGAMAGAGVGSVPNLAGQHARYIIDQLDRFADGRRPSAVMGRIAAGLDESDRAAVAAYLSGASPGQE